MTAAARPCVSSRGRSGSRSTNVVWSTKYLRVTGPIDNQERHGSHLDKRVYLKALTGGYLRIIYDRSGQRFEKTVLIRSELR